jgi:hypothetical protein
VSNINETLSAILSTAAIGPIRPCDLRRLLDDARLKHSWGAQQANKDNVINANGIYGPRVWARWQEAGLEVIRPTERMVPLG